MNTNPMIILQGKGPLPLSGSFQPPSDSPAVLYVSGTVWTSNAGNWCGVNVAVAGVQVGTVGIYLNQANTHTAFPGTFIPIDLSSAQPNTKVSITLSAANATTVSDSNDSYQVSLFY